MRVSALSRPFLMKVPTYLTTRAPPMEHSPPGADKTPTTPSRVMDLATEVDGGRRTQHIYSPSSQGRLVLFIQKGFLLSQRVLLGGKIFRS